MAQLRLFASAREAAGTGSTVIGGANVGEALEQASVRFGESFAQVLLRCAIWVNGEPATSLTAVGEHDEIAVLPPVSGG